MLGWILDVFVAFFNWLVDGRRFRYREYFKNRRVSKWARKEDKKYDR